MGLEVYSPPRELSLRAKFGLGAAAVATFFGMQQMSNAADEQEKKIEACVSDIVGHDVNLERNPDSDRLMKPAIVFDEVSACLQAQGDPSEARVILNE